MGESIGLITICGLIIGLVVITIVDHWRKQYVIETATDADLLLELKRRRVIARIEAEVDDELAKEIQS